MRTTLDIDGDVLALAKELAMKEKTTAGSVISSLARRGYQVRETQNEPERRVRNGVRMLPRRGEPVTSAHVRQIMDQEGI